jgi:hypothetical protein
MPIDASRDHLVVPAEVRVGPSPAAFMILAFWQKVLQCDWIQDTNRIGESRFQDAG